MTPVGVAVKTKNLTYISICEKSGHRKFLKRFDIHFLLRCAGVKSLPCICKHNEIPATNCSYAWQLDCFFAELPT
jgi:hypothetical protein